MSAIHSPFSSRLITSDFCSVFLSVTSFSLWIALGYVHFLFGDKSMLLKGNYISCMLNQPTHLMADSDITFC